MPGSELEILIEGAGAEELAAELGDFLKDELGVGPRRRRSSPSPTISPGATTRGVDPIGALGLVLAIPSGILAISDLAKRLETREKLDRLLAWLRRRKREAPGTRVELRPGSSGRARTLEESGTDTVLKMLEHLSEGRDW